MKTEDIYNQDADFIKTQHPSSVVKARIFSEDQRKAILWLISNSFLPHHSSVGKGHSTHRHWDLSEYKGRFGEGYKLITSSPCSSNFNHITYFVR